MERDRVISLVVPAQRSASCCQHKRYDVLSGERSLRSAWDFLQDVLIAHRIHTKFDKRIPIVFSKIIFVHVLNRLFYSRLHDN